MYKRMLVAVDGSEDSERALQHALRLAAGQQAVVRLVHVLDADLYRHAFGEDPAVHAAWRRTGEGYLDRAAAIARAAGAETETTLLENAGRRTSRVVVDEAARWGADVIVLGTHGRHGLDHMLLGSVAEGVVRSATVPVLTVRGA